jgi:hypothetical protein
MDGWIKQKVFKCGHTPIKKHFSFLAYQFHSNSTFSGVFRMILNIANPGKTFATGHSSQTLGFGQVFSNFKTKLLNPNSVFGKQMCQSLFYRTLVSIVIK